jgi:hypothetical protein
MWRGAEVLIAREILHSLALERGCRREGDPYDRWQPSITGELHGVTASVTVAGAMKHPRGGRHSAGCGRAPQPGTTCWSSWRGYDPGWTIEMPLYALDFIFKINEIHAASPSRVC